MKFSRSEAKQWLGRLTLIPDREQVILGLGTGVHVLEFAKETPGLVFVIDPRSSLVAEFLRLYESDQTTHPEFQKIRAGGYHDIMTQLHDQRFQVQQYRPCWGSLTEEFINILDLLNLRHPETAGAKYSIEQKSPNSLVSLADIKSTQDEILLLQELIR